MRKFGCNILAVVQQYDVLKTSEVGGAMIGNSKMFFKLKSAYGKCAASYRFGAGWQTGDCGFNLIQNQRSG
jgi:hypothetical protein